MNVEELEFAACPATKGRTIAGDQKQVCGRGHSEFPSCDFQLFFLELVAF